MADTTYFSLCFSISERNLVDMVKTWLHLILDASFVIVTYLGGLQCALVLVHFKTWQLLLSFTVLGFTGVWTQQACKRPGFSLSRDESSRQGMEGIVFFELLKFWEEHPVSKS
ncbi:hypothetical protein ZWY2020_024791 [Hordeum vulgare]|nr:hypothetical protein ZWY2020_024791 [Hordeum vulgare]